MGDIDDASGEVLGRFYEYEETIPPSRIPPTRWTTPALIFSLPFALHVFSAKNRNFNFVGICAIIKLKRGNGVTRTEDRLTIREKGTEEHKPLSKEGFAFLKLHLPSRMKSLFLVLLLLPVICSPFPTTAEAITTSQSGRTITWNVSGIDPASIVLNYCYNIQNGGPFCGFTATAPPIGTPVSISAQSTPVPPLVHNGLYIYWPTVSGPLAFDYSTIPNDPLSASGSTSFSIPDSARYYPGSGSMSFAIQLWGCNDDVWLPASSTCDTSGATIWSDPSNHLNLNITIPLTANYLWAWLAGGPQSNSTTSYCNDSVQPGQKGLLQGKKRGGGPGG